MTCGETHDIRKTTNIHDTPGHKCVGVSVCGLLVHEYIKGGWVSHPWQVENRRHEHGKIVPGPILPISRPTTAVWPTFSNSFNSIGVSSKETHPGFWRLIRFSNNVLQECIIIAHRHLANAADVDGLASTFRACHHQALDPVLAQGQVRTTSASSRVCRHHLPCCYQD